MEREIPCAIEVIYEHKDPHPLASHIVTLASGDKIKVCSNCAEAFAFGEVLATIAGELK